MKQEFTKQDIDRRIEAFLQKKDEEICAFLSYLARGYVSQCKVSGSYTDRTGNLRSSIGFVVARDGQVIEEDCEGGTEEGRKAGLEQGHEVLTEYSKGWVLIVFAGMHYALYVELKGYSVITSFMPGEEEFRKQLAELSSDE